jgi:hypothetical protein
VSPSGDPLLVLDFHCYVRPLTPPRFLLWHPEGSPAGGLRSEATAVRFRVIDADGLVPLPDVAAATRAMRADGESIAFAAGQIASSRVPTSLPDGRTGFAFASAMQELDELLVLVHSTAGGATSNYADDMRLRLWIVRPVDGTVDVVPQDWFNHGAYDFDYQWVTRVAREPGTGRIVGEGVRLSPFALDDSYRRVAEWLPTNPFRGDASAP